MKPKFSRVKQQTQKFQWYFQKIMSSAPIFFSGITQFTDNKLISDEIFRSVQSWTTLFHHDLFIYTFFQNPYQTFMVLCTNYMDTVQVATASMTANLKCTITWLHATKKSKKALWPLLMDGAQLAHCQSNFREVVYFLLLSSQKSLVLILPTSEG